MQFIEAVGRLPALAVRPDGETTDADDNDHGDYYMLYLDHIEELHNKTLDLALLYDIIE